MVRAHNPTMRDAITQVLNRSKPWSRPPRSRPVRFRPSRPSRARPHRAGARYFHHVENGLTGVSGPGVPEDNEAGVIGWGTSWRMQGYVLMGERTGDPAYAVRLGELIDGVLAARDEVRGTTDHRGRSGPVWSTAGKFTAATAVVEDAEGRAALEVTVCPPRALRARVDVEPDGEGRFSLTVTGEGRADFAVHGLSLDTHEARRADRVLYEAYEQRGGITARLVPLPGGSRERRQVRAGQYAVTPAHVALAAQTGMITYPIAGLARLAREREDAVPPSVRARLEEWLDLVERSVRAHEEQWQFVEGGRGCYRWLRDEPVSFAGAELPTNEFLAMGRTLIQLAAVTGKAAYVERAAAMARALRDDLVVRDGVAVWPYWPRFGRVYNGWAPSGAVSTDGSLYRPSYAPVTVPEDVTHALIDLDFLHLYRRTPGLPRVFTDGDMRAVGTTFSRNVVMRDGRCQRMRHDVGGYGRPGTDREQAHVAAWLPLGAWAPQLPEIVRAVQPAAPPGSLMGVDTYCGALLARWS